MPNPYAENKESFFYKLKSIGIEGIRPAFAITKFTISSFLLHFFDDKYVVVISKTLIFLYIFLPFFKGLLPIPYVDLTSKFFISNYFLSIIDANKYQLLTTLYLLAPLIALYFKEHGTIIDTFMSNYNNESKTEEQNCNSVLDHDKDNYDKENLSVHLSKIIVNERSLKEHLFVEKYIKWTKIIGEKRRNSSSDTRNKILMIISLLMLGMPLSLASHATIYYLLSISIFIFVMVIIFTQIVYSARNILKITLLKSATDGAYYFYEVEMKKTEPFTS